MSTTLDKREPSFGKIEDATFKAINKENALHRSWVFHHQMCIELDKKKIQRLENEIVQADQLKMDLMESLHFMTVAWYSAMNMIYGQDSHINGTNSKADEFREKFKLDKVIFDSKHIDRKI